MFCPKCKKPLPNGATFCAKCGTRITRGAVANGRRPAPSAPNRNPGGRVAPRNAIPAIVFAVGAGAMVLAAVGVIVGISAQTKTPIASFYYASENLTKDILNIQNGSFSLDVGGESITGNVALDIDDESFELYCNYRGADVAIYFEDGSGAYYMSYSGVGYADSKKLDSDTVDMITEYFEDLKTGKNSGKAEDIDWKTLVENVELDDIIDPDGIPTSLKKLEKRMRSSKTRKQLEEAMQISKKGSTYSVPLNSETICDTFAIMLDICQDECDTMFVDSMLDDFVDESDSVISELRKIDMDFGSFEWELSGKRFSSINMDFEYEGDCVDCDLDFDYSGNHLDTISAKVNADGDRMKLSMNDINKVKEVIPDSVRSEME